MVKKIFLILYGVLMMSTSVSWAHPPVSMDVKYDYAGKVLIVEMKHVTQRLLDHFIRKIAVTKNDEEPLDFYFKRQTSPTSMTAEIDIDAKEGDVLKVKAYCQEGGTKEESFIVSQEENLESEGSKDPLEKSQKRPKKGSY